MKLKGYIFLYIWIVLIVILVTIVDSKSFGFDSSFSLTLIPFILILWAGGIILLSPLGTKKHIFESGRQFFINLIFFIISIVIAFLVYYFQGDFTFSRCAIIGTLIVYGRYFIFTLFNLMLFKIEP